MSNASENHNTGAQNTADLSARVIAGSIWEFANRAGYHIITLLKVLIWPVFPPRTPCVALPTTDHKVSSFMTWLDEVDYVHFASDREDAAEHGAEWMSRTPRQRDFGWHGHFRELAHEVLLKVAQSGFRTKSR